SRMPCSTGESSANGRSTCGKKLSRKEGASRITPCRSVLYHSASASLKSSLSRICASMSPASCQPSSPRSSQAYTPCSANSRARRRALRALFLEAPAAAPRDLLVVKIFFLVVVVLVVVFRLRFQSCDQIGHFHSGSGAITALFSCADLSLLFVFRRQHAVGDRDSGFQGHATDCRSTFVADNFEVVGLATDDGTQRDKGIELKGFSHLSQSHAQFQSTWNGGHHHVSFINAQLGEFCEAGSKFGLADFLVETGTHNPDVQAFAVQIGRQSIRIHNRLPVQQF